MLFWPLTRMRVLLLKAWARGVGGRNFRLLPLQEWPPEGGERTRKEKGVRRRLYPRGGSKEISSPEGRESRTRIHEKVYTRKILYKSPLKMRLEAFRGFGPFPSGENQGKENVNRGRQSLREDPVSQKKGEQRRRGEKGQFSQGGALL